MKNKNNNESKGLLVLIMYTIENCCVLCIWNRIKIIINSLINIIVAIFKNYYKIKFIDNFLS